ncbi:hypothetical protein M427DRAFT_157210 [Gonapodya prolifera JEL478]|uniref:RING-type domain-containing protein n=1 Tax=Gonapodya prolifera (strain JEL478) TaxID=1344416 RepID=A0A139A8B9_GONPJ|nr:hypothetical protein M427DRAFT_157210 [Gonapodya prolifera JEL478]|eukprot:KXS12633.1 hypothetical protein M427DRAFT_157210 [Gonapodya prolifera JEL478]
MATFEGETPFPTARSNRLSSNNGSRSSSPAHTQRSPRERVLRDIVAAFPDIDPVYLNECLSNYELSQPELVAARVMEKLTVLNAGEYPKVPPRRNDTQSVASSDESTNGDNGALNLSDLNRGPKRAATALTIARIGRDPNSLEARNAYLEILSDAFPDADVSFLRECILETTCNVVFSVADRLLPSATPRVPRQPPENLAPPTSSYPTRLHQTPLSRSEFFRTEVYQRGVRNHLYNTFPKVAKSTIRAVVAECNHDFIEAHSRLKEMDERSWVPSFLATLFRPRSSIAEMNHPEVLADIAELERRQCAQEVAGDFDVACTLNRQQYESEGQAIGCACCFSDFPFEDLVACPAGHLFCRTCISSQINEGLFGQSRLNGRPLTCFSIEACPEVFEDAALQRVLPPDVFERYARQCVTGILDSAGLPYVICPWCRYAEVDNDREDEESRRARSFSSRMRRILGWPEPPPPPVIHRIEPAIAHAEPHVLPRRYAGRDPEWEFRVKALVWSAVFFAAPIVTVEVASFLLTIAVWTSCLGPATLRAAIIAAATRLQNFCMMILSSLRQRFGQQRIRPARILHCQNTGCSKSSCLECGAEWVGLHRCHEREEESLRLYVERRMTVALLRTCPRCQIHFTKLDGCSHMTCPQCQYHICYICRRDISTEGYQHFCTHFRPYGGRCSQCSQCGLYERENDDQVRSEAAARAVDEWLAAHPEVKDGRRMVRQLRLGLPL